MDSLAKQYLVYEKTDISEFQRKARILQSIWRHEQGYEAGHHRGKVRGNYVPEVWAKETLSNYLSDTIKQVVRAEVIDNPGDRLFGAPRIFNNLLSSQPLAFNLFAELKVDLDLASKVFSTLLPGRVSEVTKIEFEHSPGRRNPKYTDDRSAFDVYAEFLNQSGEKGFVGIEVKYHENLRNAPAQIRQRYFDIASKIDCFRADAIDMLQAAPMEQIWRDHLLACSMLNTGDFKDGLFVFLYPRDNRHCSEAVDQYRNCLSDCRTFDDWTIESVVSVIKQFTQDKWIDLFYDRYLNFEKFVKYEY